MPHATFVALYAKCIKRRNRSLTNNVNKNFHQCEISSIVGLWQVIPPSEMIVCPEM